MDLFKLFGTIEIDNSKANDALDDTSKKGQQTESKLSKFFSGVGKGAVVVGKTVATGLAVGGAAMGTLTMKALTLGGELEQNMGGSEAVFKEHAGKMQETARQAFSNMGLSTSDYLATANKMGALFQGAGFDIEESMTLSSDAMQRAADVASIMGIDTSAAMEAIAGAAKGNFTMMDNLGVAMNDTALNAYALEKGIGKTISEMSQQEKIALAMEMFMEKTAYAAGNYAKENETLAGSLGTAKAALTNFLDGSGSVEDLVTSFGNLAKVAINSLSEIAPRLVSGISDIINQIMLMIPQLLNQLLPVIIEGAVSLINGLVQAFPSIITTLMGALPSLIEGVQQIINALIMALPQIMEALVSALPTLIPLLVNALVTMIVTLCTMFPQIIQPIIDNLPQIIISIVNALMQNLPALIEGAVQLVVGLVTAMPQIILALLNAIPTIMTSIVEGLIGALPVLINGWTTIWNAVKDAISTLMDGLKTAILNIWNAIVQNVGTILSNGKEIIVSVWTAIKDIISSVMDIIKSVILGVWETIKAFISSVMNGIKSTISSIWNGIKSTISSVVNGIKSTISSVFNGIKTIASKAWNDIKDKMTKPIQTAKDKIKGIVDTVKGFFSGMKLSFPNIKMPHFSISPSGWKIGDLLEGSIPTLGIEWYAKAMNNPMIMTKPTVFGYNAATGSFQAGGEAGSEVVSGTNTLMNMISTAVSGQNSELVMVLYRILEAILAMDENMGGNLREALAGTSFEINKREFARLVKAVN